MPKNKYYVVWNGREPGIYDSWAKCLQQIEGFNGAEYKAFATKELAKIAFADAYKNFIGKETKTVSLSKEEIAKIGKPVPDSISVDGAWNTATGAAEYQGVHTTTQKLLFRQGPFVQGTNNIVEFLGIVHALAYCKQHHLNLPIYSDSRNAINWVRYKNVRTKLIRTKENEPLFQLLDRAVDWLHKNTYSNKILKWETKAWGENPADFGRK